MILVETVSVTFDDTELMDVSAGFRGLADLTSSEDVFVEVIMTLVSPFVDSTGIVLMIFLIVVSAVVAIVEVVGKYSETNVILGLDCYITMNLQYLLAYLQHEGNEFTALTGIRVFCLKPKGILFK